jgi:hypothetical protein
MDVKDDLDVAKDVAAAAVASRRHDCSTHPFNRRASQGRYVGATGGRLAGAPVFPRRGSAGTFFRTMTDSFRELDRRSNDRIDVRLLWRQRDDRVIVTVADGKTGKRFTVDVADSESALDVFHHPFAYAA